MELTKHEKEIIVFALETEELGIKQLPQTEYRKDKLKRIDRMIKGLIKETGLRIYR